MSFDCSEDVRTDWDAEFYIYEKYVRFLLIGSIRGTWDVSSQDWLGLGRNDPNRRALFSLGRRTAS